MSLIAETTIKLALMLLWPLLIAAVVLMLIVAWPFIPFADLEQQGGGE